MKKSTRFFIRRSCRVLRLDEVSDFFDADIILKFPVAAASAQPPVFILFFLEAQEPLLYERNKRKGPSAGIGFRRVLGHEDMLAVQIDRRYGVLDRDGVMLKIYGFPFKANRMFSGSFIFSLHLFGLGSPLWGGYF